MATPRTNVRLGPAELTKCIRIEDLVARLQSEAENWARTPDTVPWFEEGEVTEIDEITLRQYVATEPLRPHISHDAGGRFLLFWRCGDRYFARPLTAAESARFCDLFDRVRN